MDEKALGQRLQLARKRAKLTQQELCQKAGLSYSTLAKIERGAIRSPSVFTVAAIANATSTPIERLLDLKPADSPAPQGAKKRSKNGVRFVYFDVNGTLVRFFERAFDELAKKSGKPIEQVEALYWRTDQRACSGLITPEEANHLMAAELGLKSIDWLKCHLDHSEPTPHSAEMLKWVAEHYEVGLLTNGWLGFADALIRKKLIPKVEFAAIVESAKVKHAKPDPKIYEIAQDMAGVSADEILFVDDNALYLTSADKCGWHTLRFNAYEPAESAARVKQALEF